MAELQIEVTHLTIERTKTSIAAKQYCCDNMVRLWGFIHDNPLARSLAACPFCGTPVVRLPDVYQTVNQK